MSAFFTWCGEAIDPNLKLNTLRKEDAIEFFKEKIMSGDMKLGSLTLIGYDFIINQFIEQNQKAPNDNI